MPRFLCDEDMHVVPREYISFEIFYDSEAIAFEFLEYYIVIPWNMSRLTVCFFAGSCSLWVLDIFQGYRYSHELKVALTVPDQKLCTFGNIFTNFVKDLTIMLEYKYNKWK